MMPVGASGAPQRSGRRRLEVSNVIISFDPATGERLPVAKDDVVRRLQEVGDRRVARRVGRLPVDDDGTLSPAAVDELLVRMHTQLQRLWEELQQGDLALTVLGPLLAAVGSGHPNRAAPLRVVDVGCGLGYFVRWAAATGALGADVEVSGCDLDRVLIDEARRLADAEGLRCRFAVGDAFDLPEAADVYLSSGLLHHLRVEALPAFFAAQAEAKAFVHWDIAPTYLAALGAWVFHRARMRDPLARHDGVRSVQRAHCDADLLGAAATGVPRMASALHGVPRSRVPVLDVIRPLLCLQPELVESFKAELGPVGASRLVSGQGPW